MYTLNKVVVQIFKLIPFIFFVACVDAQTQLPDKVRGENLTDCAEKLSVEYGGWCEVKVSDEHPSISNVWPKNLPRKIRMHSSSKAVLTAWNSAAFDKKNKLLYFTGGGHANYGGNEVYRYNMNNNVWTLLTEPDPLNYLFIERDYDKKKKKPWRRLCWVNRNSESPASAHTYDGLIYSNKTKTIFYYAMNAANGSCIEDKDDKYRNSSLIVGHDKFFATGWYEFNPSESQMNNDLAPLKWRKIFDFNELKTLDLHKGYPVTAELNNGNIVFGTRYKTVVYNPDSKELISLKAFTSQKASGDGSFIHDNSRTKIWFVHKKGLTGFDSESGQQISNFPVQVPHGKSLAVDSSGRLVAWNGHRKVLYLEPDSEPQWQEIDWVNSGPNFGNERVYGKWVYLKDLDLFAGISIDKTGMWYYRSPKRLKNSSYYASIDPQKLVDETPSGGAKKIPSGIYGQGLFINKSIKLDLAEVDLRGVVKQKALINIHCDKCDVTLNNFKADGILANCLFGNCAGIKVEGKNFHLTVNNAHINNTVMGIITDNRGGTVVVNDSVIENTGLNDSSTQYAHGFYAGRIDRVELNNTTIRSSNGNGHLFKSRAPKTSIINSHLLGGDGLHSRTIDFPCGGELTVSNSVLQHGKQTDNADVISVGTEAKSCKGKIFPSSVNLDNNWVVIERQRTEDERGKNRGRSRLFTWIAPLVEFTANNNRIVDLTGQMALDNNGKVPELNSSNKVFTTKKAAGLVGNQIP